MKCPGLARNRPCTVFWLVLRSTVRLLAISPRRSVTMTPSALSWAIQAGGTAGTAQVAMIRAAAPSPSTGPHT